MLSCPFCVVFFEVTNHVRLSFWHVKQQPRSQVLSPIRRGEPWERGWLNRKFSLISLLLRSDHLHFMKNRQNLIGNNLAF